jgi:hypothetical protein
MTKLSELTFTSSRRPSSWVIAALSSPMATDLAAAVQDSEQRRGRV